MRFLTTLTILASCTISLITASDSPNDHVSTFLFVSEPHCNSYKCRIDWYPGQTIMVNWIWPPNPSGNVTISLVPESDFSLRTYSLAKIRALTDRCDNGGTKHACGRWNGTLPTSVRAGEYSIKVSGRKKRSHKVIDGYTDVIRVGSKPKAHWKQHKRRFEDAEDA